MNILQPKHKNRLEVELQRRKHDNPGERGPARTVGITTDRPWWPLVILTCLFCKTWSTRVGYVCYLELSMTYTQVNCGSYVGFRPVYGLFGSFASFLIDFVDTLRFSYPISAKSSITLNLSIKKKRGIKSHNQAL